MLQLLGRKPIGRTRCPDARALLASYVEGELDTVDRERVSGHLQLCTPCQVEERKFRAALTALAAAEPIPAPRDLYAGFAARLEATHLPYRRRALRLRLAGAAACLLLVSAVVASPHIQGILIAEPEDIAIKPSRVIQGDARLPNDAPLVKLPAQVVKERPAPDSDDGEIIQPDPFEPRPEHSAGGSRSANKRPVVVESFRDVKPETGLPAKDQIRLQVKGRDGGETSGARPVPKNAIAAKRLETDSGFIPERYERIQVGDSVTTVRTGYKVDEEGRRTVVNVDIGTTSVPN